MTEFSPAPLPVPPPPQRRRVPAALVAGVVGVVIGGVGVGVPWLLSGGGGGTDFGGGGSSASISAPATLGSLQPLTTASAHLGASGSANARNIAADDDQSAKLLSTAYGGAAALVAHYSDDQLANLAILSVVRAASPQPYEAYENLKELGFSQPEKLTQQVGDVTCDVNNEPPVTSGTEPTDSVYVAYCQRTAPGLTVRVQVTGDLQHHPDQVAGLVDSAWSTVH